MITLNVTSGSYTTTLSRDYAVPDWALSGLMVQWDMMTFQANYTLISVETNWRNTTWYVYLNSSLIITSTSDPGTINMTRPSNAGEYNLTIYVDSGTETYTIKNIRYRVSAIGVSYDYSQTPFEGGGVTNNDYFVDGDFIEPGTLIIDENPPGMFITSDAMLILLSSIFVAFVMIVIIMRRWEVLERIRTLRMSQ